MLLTAQGQEGQGPCLALGRAGLMAQFRHEVDEKGEGVSALNTYCWGSLHPHFPGDKTEALLGEALCHHP